MTTEIIQMLFGCKQQFTSLRLQQAMSENPKPFTEVDVLYEQYLTNYLNWFLRSWGNQAENSYYEQFGRPEDEEPTKPPNGEPDSRPD